MAKTYAHLQFMTDNKITKDSDFLSAATKRAITNFETLQESESKMTDKEQKNLCVEQMSQKTVKIKEMLEEDFEAYKADKQKKDADEQANQEKANKKKLADRAKAVGLDENATEKEIEAAEKAKKAGAGKSKDDNENLYDLSEKQLAVKKILDKLFSEKQKAGVLNTTEKELSDSGIDMWNTSGIGMFSGEIGPYKMKSSGGEEWIITKEKQAAEKKD